MRTGVHSAMFAVIVLFASQVAAQTTGGDKLSESDTASANPWAFSVLMSGYLVPDDESYASPVFTADRQWLHLEARYNYEYQKTGSLWAGYNFSAGDKVEFEVTPNVWRRVWRYNGDRTRLQHLDHTQARATIGSGRIRV